MDLFRNIFSPQKASENDDHENQRVSPSPSPLGEQHPNRVQKHRQKARNPARNKGATRAPRLPARILGSPELGDERGDRDPFKVSRRHSEYPKASARLNNLSSDDEHNNTIAEGISVSLESRDNDATMQDGAAGSPVGFASQPAHLATLPNIATQSSIKTTQEDDFVASTSPDHEMADADSHESEEEERIIIETVEPEPQPESEKEREVNGQDVIVAAAGSDPFAEDEDDSPKQSVAKVTAPKRASAKQKVAKGKTSEPEAIGVEANTEPVSKAEQETTTQVEEEEEEEAAEDPNQFIFTEILNHRWVGDVIEIKVGWYKSKPTWEPETNIHEDAPDALFAYWRSQGGRPDNPNDAELFDIFAIRKHSRDKKQLFVEWTGYEPSMNSWVPSKVVQETAPEIVRAYWASLKKPKTRRRK